MTFGVATLEECESIGNRTTCFNEEVTLPLYTNTVTFVLSKEVDYAPGRVDAPEFSNVRWK